MEGYDVRQRGIFREKITRPGADALLDYLENKSDFFTAPASARYHGAYAGGLCDHSLNVYHCLVDYLARERVQELYGLEYSEESVAVVALLHDLCKVGCYKKSFRNVKNDATGQWERVPTFTFDDPLPYGHGEKSVYIVNGFIRLRFKNIRSPSPWPQRTWRRLISWKMKKTRKKAPECALRSGLSNKTACFGENWSIQEL